jgi:hypothetical protein
VNNTVNFNTVSPHHIENKVRLDDEHAVTECPELFMLGNTAG